MKAAVPHEIGEVAGYDVVLDHLWGRPTEILLRSLIPKSFAFPTPTRLIQIGQSAGVRHRNAAPLLPRTLIGCA